MKTRLKCVDSEENLKNLTFLSFLMSSFHTNCMIIFLK
jgi:hypothetical protein